VVVRPFYDGDVQDLADSFARFDSFAPCALDGSNNPTAAGLPVNLILYYSGDTASSDATSTIAKLDGIVNNNDNAAWRHCFETISIVSAQLSDAEDLYHTDQTDSTWNLGPNLQFYKLVEYMTSYSSTDRFYYMEGDSIPIAANWLDALTAEVFAKAPFSVLGSRYSGHNWDKLTGVSGAISDALKYHLNGNAVYDVSHTLVLDALSAYTADTTFATTMQSSFDVRLAEMLINDPNDSLSGLGISEGDLESNAASQYKQTALLANFATTLTLPHDIDSSAVKVVHGAVYLQNWPSPACPRELNPTWYPGLTMSEDSSSQAKLTLIVSDTGGDGFFPFFHSLLAAGTYAETQVSGTGCESSINNPLDALPFSKIIVVTTDEGSADTYKAALGFETLYPSEPLTTFGDGNSIHFVVRDEKNWRWLVGSLRHIC
jgi:hypothetical protein